MCLVVCNLCSKLINATCCCFTCVYQLFSPVDRICKNGQLVQKIFFMFNFCPLILARLNCISHQWIPRLLLNHQPFNLCFIYNIQYMYIYILYTIYVIIISLVLLLQHPESVPPLQWFMSYEVQKEFHSRCQIFFFCQKDDIIMPPCLYLCTENNILNMSMQMHWS